MKNVKNVIKGLLVGMVVVVGCLVNGNVAHADIVNTIDNNIVSHYTLPNGDVKTIYKDGSFYVNTDVEIQSISYIDNTITINKDGQLYSFYVDNVKDYYLYEQINVTMDNNNEIVDCVVDNDPIIYNEVSVINSDAKVCCIKINDNVYSFVNDDSSYKVNDKVDVIMQGDNILEVHPVVSK